MIIAIDGPAGSGKSSTARAIAERLGGYYLDTGAMYRAIGVYFRRLDVALEDDITSFVDGLHVDVALRSSGVTVSVNGLDVTEEIRTDAASELASSVSRLPEVRRRLVSEQRRIGHELSGAGHWVVVEGRDIGTVVFPDAAIKFYMDADPKVRAQRRHSEMLAAGDDTDLRSVLRSIQARDKQDREREHSPLRKADDAITINTTRLTPDEQVDMMLTAIAKRYRNQDSSKH